MNRDLWHHELQTVLEKKSPLPKYQVLADAIAAAIHAGALLYDEQLPTVRALAETLGMSGTTVAAAYRILAQKGMISGRVGSGTRVSAGRRDLQSPILPGPAARAPARAALWRRRSQTNHIATLLRMYPNAQNYASGTPNPDLLLLAVLQRAWVSAAAQMQAADLQYGSPTPLPALTGFLLERLERDLIPARAADLMIGSSAQQFLTLAAGLAAGATGGQLLVGVEEPGYPTLFDAYERLGSRLLGIALDGEGVLPDALEAVLRQGAGAVALTPRAHNPTGVSWSPARRAALADVLAAYPGVLIIEDDPFAEAANSRGGSLLQDPRLEDRVVYIRSFSKVVAPDLRLAVAVARQPLRALLIEGKFYTDGWSSTFSQQVLANALADSEFERAADRTRQTCNRRRRAFAETLSACTAPETLKVSPAVDGVNVWLELGRGLSAAEVAERAAASGVLVAASDPFFVRAGRDDALRVNVGMLADDEVASVAHKLVTALEDAARSAPAFFSHHGL